jgi:hypothetical protein
MVAGYVAMSNEHSLVLDLCDFDVPGAFLQTNLTALNTPQECYIHFAGDIRHPCAGKWFRRFSGTYGSRDANNLFDTDFADTCATAQFFPNPEQPKIFTRVHPTDSKLSCSVSMHVDDGLVACTHRPFLVELRRILEDRYGLLTWNDVVESNTGFHFERFADGSITVDQHGYEHRMLQDLGATTLPHVDRASLADFFDPPTDLTPVNQHEYRKIIGCLIHLLPTWHCIRKEIVHLSRRQGVATQSDLNKVIRVLAYINTERKNYIRFSGSDSQVYIWADASPNAHPTGHGQGGYYITIGSNSGAISAHARIQDDCIAQGAMEAEYVVLARASKEGVHYRRLLAAMGIPQHSPITVFDDNQSAINLTNAPSVTKHSRHINVRYHLIRDYAGQGILRMVKVPGTNNPADLFTKTLSTPLALRYGNIIHNTAQGLLTPFVPLGVGGNVSM